MTTAPIIRLAEDVSSWADLESRIIALTSEQERGEAFEEFCRFFFILAPVFQFREVFRQQEIPLSVRQRLGYPGIQDIGIDGLCVTSDDKLFAYQAKFRMPNHFHGILIISDDCRGTLQRAPTSEQFGKPASNSIPTIVRLFKATTTKQINQIRNSPGVPVWQRNYYEHIIRSEPELHKKREYIANNPLNWETDENFKN